MKNYRLYTLGILVGTLLTQNSIDAEVVQSWTLKESLGFDWKNELVNWPVKDGVNVNSETFSVLNENNEPVPFQVTWKEQEGDPTPRIAVLVNLPPYTSRKFSLVKTKTSPVLPTDLKVRNEAQFVEILAGRTGVRLGRTQSFKPGMKFSDLPPPILSVKVVSGRWLGKGSVTGGHPVTQFFFEMEANGPLFAQAKLRYEFGPRKFYQIRVRLISGEDVVLVEEDFALSTNELDATTFVRPPDLAPPIGTPSNYSDWLVNKGIGWNDIPTDMAAHPCFRFNFTHGWEADRARGVGIGQRKKSYSRDDLKNAQDDWRLGFVLTPFQERGYRQNAVGFDKEGGQDYLGVFYRFMSRWKHPNENRVLMPWMDDGIVGHFPAYEGRRKWGMMVTTPGEHTNDVLGERDGRKFGAIRRPHVKHGETPLDKVKDWTLEWQLPEASEYPRIFFNRDGLNRMQKEFQGLPDSLKNQIKGDRGAWALLSGDESASAALHGHLNGYMKVCTLDFLNGGSNTMNTYTHRYQEILRSEGRALDVLLSDEKVTVEQRRRILAWVAFNAYKVSDPDYWAYRGYGGGPSNPNMMSIACNALATCAALLAGHPKQSEWLKLCERLVSADITNSIGPEGAWLESPGYQGAGNAPINMTVLILKNAGVADLAKHPVHGKRLISVSRYYANLLTPPDPRFAGLRMPMAMGDGSPFTTNYTTFLAHSARDAFPEEAGNAIWCWQQMGSPAAHTPLILLHERVMSGDVQPVPIKGTSVQFPGFGAMLRHGFGTADETFLTYHHSGFSYGHYDDDLGSFSLFAKGAPLCLDWINYSPNDAKFHNRVTYDPKDYPWSVPPLDKFTSHTEADYIRSHETGIYHSHPSRTAAADAAPDWQRQLILVKDTVNPGDATYLVVRDKVDALRPSTTNVWTMAEKGSEKIDGNIARLKGQYGVDVSLFFYRKPNTPLAAKFHHFQPRGLKFPQDQTRVQASSPKGGDFGYVLYPIRRDKDREPVVRELPSGVVELRWSDTRRHLVFLFPEATTVKESGVDFNGRAAVVKYAGDKRTLVPLEIETLK